MNRVVVSDLHFGDTRCSLHDMSVVRKFTESLKKHHPIEEVILLGDVLDLQLANWAQAIEGRLLRPPQRKTVGFRYFLNFLLQETQAKRVVYVPGNHDYRIFEYHSLERHLIGPLRNGKKLSGKVSFFRTFADGFLRGILEHNGVELRVVYPHYSIRVGKANVLLTHGHFFDPSQAFFQEAGKAFGQSSSLSAEQIRQLRSKYFRRISLYQNMVSGFSMKRELREWFNAFYQPVTAIKQKFAHKTRKRFLTPAMINSIKNYVNYCCRTRQIHALIFGHTHNAGHAVLWGTLPQYIWNCGTFLRESSDGPLGTYIIIDGSRRLPLAGAVTVHEIR